MATIKYGELKQLYETLGPRKTCEHFREALDSKSLRAEDFSVRDCAEALIEDGREFVRALSNRKSGGASLLEAAHAVDTTAFSNITGQLVFGRMLERYNDPAFIGGELCTTMPTTFQDGERIPGMGRLGDGAEIVKEGQPYPKVGLTEEYIDTAPTVKRGLEVDVTREIIIGDRTGLLLKNAGEGGYWMGMNREKRILDVVFGIVNNYKRNGTATNTYLSSGAYINTQSNTLVNWTDIEAAELLFDAITDPNTGEPIDVMADTIIVPTALKHTAGNVLNSTQVWSVDTTASVANSVRSQFSNPVGPGYRVVSSPQVKARTNSAAKWYFGQPKRAFNYFSVWDIETIQAPSNSEAEFTHDIMMRFKASEKGVAQVVQPRYMVENT